MKVKESFIDRAIKYFSPERGCRRAQFRSAYEVLEKDRTNKPRGLFEGTGDTILKRKSLARLRSICRDLGRNSPIIKGILKTEANGVVGSSTVIHAKTEDEIWNDTAERLWREEMLETPCETTNRFNFHSLLHRSFRSYRRDGDFFVIFTDKGLQMIEGDRVGNPGGMDVKSFTHFDVFNGVAIAKVDGEVIGYYIGKPDKWGYIKSNTYKKFKAGAVYHWHNPDRFSQSRGEPALVPSVAYVDKLEGYVNAELLSAKVNACFSIFIKSKDNTAFPGPYKGGISPNTGNDPTTGTQLEKAEPGTILYGGNQYDDAKVLSQGRPTAAFDPFVLRLTAIIARPLCMPMCLATLDFHGVTNVNARLIFQEARSNWKQEQEFVVRPFVQKVWRYKIDEWIERGLLKDRLDKYRSEILLKRWPYVDPYKEANADRLKLEAGTESRTAIVAREGKDWKDVIEERSKEEEKIKELEIVLKPQKEVLRKE